MDKNINIIPEDINFSKAQDEVVAIILSAIIGSIVESWEIVQISEHQSDFSLHFKEDENEQTDAWNDSTIGSNIEEIETTATYYNYGSQSFSKMTKVAERAFQTRGGQYYNWNNRVDNSYEEKHTSILKTLFESLKESIFGWQFLDMDKEVIIVFKQGNIYKGKLSNCRMNGYGKFYWADGSVYEGEFLGGEMLGEGCLQWPDQSWYEGELRQGYRHGQGLFVASPVFYTGHWQCGLRHGLGIMFYDRSITDRHYYSGEWVRDCKQGEGRRSYATGAVYTGHWELSTRQGLGTMVWTNNDVYSGNWQNGLMHGYGEYTWSTIFNEQLVVPQENCFYGNWEKGFRHGNGTLETTLGVTVRGMWNIGKKHGPAEIICNNGVFVYSNTLFNEDCIGLFSKMTNETDSLMDATVQSMAQPYKVPVNAANHDIDLSFYIDRLSEFILNCGKAVKPFSRITSATEQHSSHYWCNKVLDLQKNKIMFGGEEIELRNIIQQHLSALKVVYTKYAELCCDVKPNFPTVMMRLMLWQLFRDCNLHKRGLSLADFDVLIANNRGTLVQGIHYPFERLQFWQFLHCIIEVSWELYGKKRDGSVSVPGLMASALHRLITRDILPNVGKHKGNALLKYKNMLSIDSVYWLYRGIGEPHSARKLLENVFLPPEEKFNTTDPEYPEHLINGKNVIGVGGRLIYSPQQEPLFPNIKVSNYSNHSQEMNCLRGIGLLTVFDCLTHICPSICAADGLIVNMNYKIIFLEFYEILLQCASLNIKLNKIKNKSTEDISEVYPEENVSQHIESCVEDDKSVIINKIKNKKATKKKKK